MNKEQILVGIHGSPRPWRYQILIFTPAATRWVGWRAASHGSYEQVRVNPAMHSSSNSACDPDRHAQGRGGHSSSQRTPIAAPKFPAVGNRRSRRQAGAVIAERSDWSCTIQCDSGEPGSRPEHRRSPRNGTGTSFGGWFGPRGHRRHSRCKIQTLKCFITCALRFLRRIEPSVVSKECLRLATQGKELICVPSTRAGAYGDPVP
jgi:hypothetical protein